MKKRNYRILKKIHYELDSTDPSWEHQLDAGTFYSFESLCEEIAYKNIFENKKFANTCFENNAECEYFEAVKNRYIRLLIKTIKPIETVEDGKLSFNETEIKIGLILRNDWNPIGFGALLPNDEYDSYVPKMYQFLQEGAAQKMIEAYLEHIETTVIGLKRNKKNQNKMEILTKNIAEKLCELKKEIK